MTTDGGKHRRVGIGVRERSDMCEMSNSTELGKALVLTPPYVQVHSARTAAGHQGSQRRTSLDEADGVALVGRGEDPVYEPATYEHAATIKFTVG